MSEIYWTCSICKVERYNGKFYAPGMFKGRDGYLVTHGTSYGCSVRSLKLQMASLDESGKKILLKIIGEIEKEDHDVLRCPKL